MTNKRWLVLMVTTLAAVIGIGCSSAPPPAVIEPAQAVIAPRETVAAAVEIDAEIARACDLPSAHFDFDSSHVRVAADDHLDRVAACFVSGPLAGRRLTLVGHADPRGETEYNFALGHRRAGAIADSIVSRGVEKNRVATTSRGEIDAVGSDETGWARDRRVDVVLAD